MQLEEVVLRTVGVEKLISKADGLNGARIQSQFLRPSLNSHPQPPRVHVFLERDDVRVRREDPVDCRQIQGLQGVGGVDRWQWTLTAQRMCSLDAQF